MAKTNYQTIDEYISTFPDDVRAALESIRQSVKDAVPEAEEVISYQIPAFTYHGMLIYFSAYKEHYSISFPPPFTVFDVFQEQLSPYTVSKSVVQFPKSAPVPLGLIGDMVKYRAQENAEKARKKT